MIGIDTNVLVRYLTQDEPTQSARATRFFESELGPDNPGYISIVVLVETVWVLQRLYRATPPEIRGTIRELLGSDRLHIDQRDVVGRAITIADEQGCGLADAIIFASAVHAGCSKVVSFDRGAVRAGMTLMK
ncbi:MAG: type II toxin-antitoxin system VapC family toxin [Gammaproteobacteria bacterium]|nr:type II toxin-antitoxin system VapC family toxin [Gammaproteobacteria bacterium]